MCVGAARQLEGVSADVTSTESGLNSLKTRQNALVNNLKGADSPKGNILRFKSYRDQDPEMGGDTDDLISLQNVAVLLGKKSIFYHFTNQFRFVMRPIKINDSTYMHLLNENLIVEIPFCYLAKSSLDFDKVC